MFVIKPLEKVLRRGLLSLQAKNEVARFEGIIISDPQEKVLFRETVLAALHLIKDLDPRRFRRLQKYIKWIVNVMLPYGGAEYAYSMRTCKIDFEKTIWEPWGKEGTILCATTLVHEATHGAIRARGIPYSPQLRSKIERLCVREEQRFLRRVKSAKPETVKYLQVDFDESRWHPAWNNSFWQSLIAFAKRLSRDARAQRAARRTTQS